MALACLGTADSLGTGGRHCAGYLVRTPDTQIVLEAGPSILTALKARDQDMEALDGVALSHLHGDHFAGLPFLILEYAHRTRRTRPFRILGPPGTERRIRDLLNLLYSEVKNRELGFDLHFEEVGAAATTEVGGVRITSFRVPHQEHDLSLGYALESHDHKLVFSGDTRWTPDLLRHSEGADLFLCECTDFDKRSGNHIRYRDIEENQSSFSCGQLLLTHLGPEVHRRRESLAAMTADDGLEISLGPPGAATAS